MALNPARFGRLTLRDSAAQRRLAQLQGLPPLSSESDAVLPSADAHDDARYPPLVRRKARVEDASCNSPILICVIGCTVASIAFAYDHGLMQNKNHQTVGRLVARCVGLAVLEATQAATRILDELRDKARQETADWSLNCRPFLTS